MANLHKLKEQARALEQGGQHQAALELFSRAAQQADSASVEPEVWVRLGELQHRTGRDYEAVSSYQSAVTALADAELRNCALAVCLRILEIDADHADAYLRMGELGAALGYPRHARRGYLEFAERAVREGSVHAAREALRAYLAHFPDDAAARRLLVDACLSEGEARQAVAELKSLEALLRRRGALAAAAEVSQELVSLHREAELPGAEAPGGADQGGAGADAPLELLPLRPMPTDRAEPAAPGRHDELGVEPTLIPTSHEDSAHHVPRLEGLEPTLADVEPEGVDDGSDALPLLGLEHHALGGLEPPPRAGEAADPEAEDDGSEAEELEPLPLLGTGFDPGEPSLSAPAPAPEVSLRDRLIERIEARPEDLDAWRRLIALLRETGARAELAATLRRAHPFVARAGHPDEAADLLEWLGELEALDSAALKQRVDYATRAGDQQRTVRALLALAGGLLAERDLAGADAAFRRVLEIEPENVEAQRALHLHAPSPLHGDQDYVDLGALILDGAPEGMSALAPGPSSHGGASQRFDDLLALFGVSAAEPIAPHDAASHYDLGLAFKEMGLLDDAVAQLHLALRGGANPLATLEALGECVFHRGDVELAERVLRRAAELPGASDTDLVGVRYWLGRCEQAAGRTADALDFYQQVIAVDDGFRDAAPRIRELRSL